MGGRLFGVKDGGGQDAAEVSAFGRVSGLKFEVATQVTGRLVELALLFGPLRLEQQSGSDAAFLQPVDHEKGKAQHRRRAEEDEKEAGVELFSHGSASWSLGVGKAGRRANGGS